MPATEPDFALTDDWQLFATGSGVSIAFECPHGSSGRYAITTDNNPANVAATVDGHEIRSPSVEGLQAGEFIMIKGRGVAVKTEGLV